MADNLNLMLTAFGVTILLGLAFGILIRIFVASEVERWFGKNSISQNAGAVEGDDRNFRVSPDGK